MANDLDAVFPRILTGGLMVLRNNTIMPRLVNRDYDTAARQKGATVDVPVPPEIAVKDVAPANTPPATDDLDITTVQVALDNWKEAPFYLTDKDQKQVMTGTLPMAAESAVASLAQTIDEFILSMYKGFYGSTGETTNIPFHDEKTTDAVQLMKVLNEQKAPKMDRMVVVGPDAEANALGLRAFQDMSFSGSNAGIQEAEIRRKFGAQWFSDQNVQTHTTTAAGSWLVNRATAAADVTSIPIDGGTTAPAEGDLFKVAGDTQQYVVTSYASNAMSFYPKAKVAWANNAAITFVGNHKAHIGFQRQAIAFVTRPLEDQGMNLGNRIASATDPVSGVTLRLEVSREHKRNRWSYDILYGGKVIRPELGARLIGKV